jgi:hypothetical protein
MVGAAHPMWVNMLRFSCSHCFAKPKSHSFTRPGRLPSSSVLSSFRSLKTGNSQGASQPESRWGISCSRCQGAPVLSILHATSVQSMRWLQRGCLQCIAHLWATLCAWQYATAVTNCLK